MAVTFVNPKRAEELAKSPEICNDPNLYVVLTRQIFTPIENAPYPNDAKIVYFDIASRTYSKAYVCNNGKLELKKNYNDWIKNMFYYHNNVLVADVKPKTPVSSNIFNAFKPRGGLDGKRAVYMLNPAPDKLAYLYKASKIPYFTSFVTPGSEAMYVYALKVQDICIIYPQETPEAYNFMLALCGEKPLAYLDDPSITAESRIMLNGVLILKNLLVEPFEFKRAENSATNS